ncbi:MAG: amidohydrolase [Methanocalculus sp. MSAO_Arc1]|uniref:amidohydrolase n=1 Tax=Methanocalculus TaxID=71151 RepID=UPI000FEFB639|nr:MULTISPECIES: amidohydrolase [unclassified Methanocalculus]MCP1662473.1 5-methylthioadenosine/S-adenosylhomocysteine deaminase [Methanocalculus sp. AMF5]RQD80817.1 MAG: amidohydrolase [Methanocalculus sp. MSAO_Arc1]
MIPYNKQTTILIRDANLDCQKTDIYIEGGIIQAVGEGIRSRYKNTAEIEIDAGGDIILPGLVNTHTHAAMSLLRGYADDMILFEWLSEKIWPLEAHLTGDDVYWGTRLACLEMIKSGTVAFNDMYFHMDRAADAVEESGMRACLAHGFIDLFTEEKREAEIRATTEFHKNLKSRNNPKLTFATGPHALYTVSPEGLSWCASYANEHDSGIHIHLSETQQELDDCIKNNNATPAAYLDTSGILTDRTVAAHCCYLDEAECELLGRRGTAASHNPASNMKLAGGRAIPYQALLDAGAPITLGTDGCASNNNLDLFEEMKIAALLQKFSTRDPTILPAAEAVDIAARNGAAALRTGGGIISPGFAADIILVDRNAICQAPFHNPLSNIVYACGGNAVRTVICDGAVLMHDREIPGEDAILAGAEAAAVSLVKRREEELLDQA